MKHTPGPWTAAEVIDEDWTKKRWSVLAGEGPKTKALIRVSDYDVKWSKGMAQHERLKEADAHLIAAAPDMYALLSAIREWAQEGGALSMDALIGDDDTTAGEAILAALAKAEGR